MQAGRRAWIIEQYYINRRQIKELLGIPRKQANALFDEIDQCESVKRFRPHPNKVPLPEVLKLAGVDYNFLRKQIKQESEAR